ncbi:MAG: HDOD domain-containing protein [Planctomycetota bacterium]|nr:HDOD domain-containing protein [Planctomycetota bacterium]
MHGDPSQIDPTQSRRVELILQQLDALPTLSAVAVRVLELTSDDSSEMSDVINLISCDPALASKVLKVCRCSEQGRAANVTTIDRAVVLLGFDNVRSAVLSLQIFEMFDGDSSCGGEEFSAKTVFSRQLYWQHSLAVAIVAEKLCSISSLKNQFHPSEAFIGGLLHDLGQLCLHMVLPKSFDRVCELALAQNLPLDLACRKTVGVDAHTAGRRIAEHWQLPHQLSDIIWLHGQPYEALPDLNHKPLIGLISLADAIVRREHIAPLGHGAQGENIEAMCTCIGLTLEHVEEVVPIIHDELALRSEGMGLESELGTRQLLRSVCRANEVLGRANLVLRQSASCNKSQKHIFEAITEFHDTAVPGATMTQILGRVVQSAAEIWGQGFYSLLYQANDREPLQYYQFDEDARLQHSQIFSATDGGFLFDDMTDNQPLNEDVRDRIPELGDVLEETIDLKAIKLLPLRCGWGVNAVLVHDRTIDAKGDRVMLEALSRTWGASLAAGNQHEGAKRVGEQLVEANRELMETQDRLAQVKTMAALGELAAGAAHEMNNPLTVISGRSQILLNSIIDPEQRSMAKQIALQSHRLSNIITALRLFANPTESKPKSVNLQELIGKIVREVKPKRRKPMDLNSVFTSDIPTKVFIDPDQIGRAVTELLQNAVEAEGSSHVELRVQIDASDDRLKIQVTDDGSGLAPHTLTHAFDPFFSAKPAGRQPGLGLSQAQRLVEASGGQITLENGSLKGAVATIWLPHWREHRVQESRNVA